MAASATLELLLRARDEASQAIQNVREHMGGLERVSGLVRAAMGALAGAGLGQAFQTLSQDVLQTNELMARFAAVTGASAEDVRAMTGVLNELFRTNTQGRETIAGVMQALATLQGVSTSNAEMMKTLTQAYLDFSKVTGIDAVQAVAAFDDVLDAWGLSAEDAQTLMDALVVSHREFGTSVEGALGALNRLAPAFQALGLDINTALGYINLFATAGIDAEGTARAFNQALNLLSDTSEEGVKKLTALAEMAGYTRGEFAAFMDLKPEEQFRFLAERIGITGEALVKFLELKPDEKFSVLAQKVGLAGDELLKFKTATPEEKMAILAEKIGLAKGNLGEFLALSPAEKFQVLTQAIASMEDPAERAQLAIELFGARAGPALANALAQSGGSLQQFQVDLATASGATAQAAEVINSTITERLKILGHEILGRASELTQQLGPAFQIVAALAGPLAPIIGGIAGAFSGLASTIASSLMPTLMNLALTLGPYGAIALALAGLGVAIFMFRDQIVQAFDFIRDRVGDAMEKLKELLQQHWQEILSIASLFLLGPSGLVVLFTTNAFGIRDKVAAAFEELKGKLQEIWNSVKDFLASNWQEILSIASIILLGPGGLVALFTTNAFGIRDTVVEAFTNMRDWVVERMGALKDGAISLLEDLLSWVSSLPGRILDALGDMGGLLWDAGRALIQGLIGGIQDKLNDLRGFLGGIKNKIIEWKGPITDDRQLLVPAGQAIMEGLVVGLTSGMSDVQETLQTVSSTVVSELEKLRNAVNSTTFAIADALSQLRNHLIVTEQTVKGTISRMREAVAEGLSKIVSATTESSPEMAGFADAVSKAASQIIEVINRSTFSIADALAQLRPHFWMLTRVVQSQVSDIGEALDGLVKTINNTVFSIADALSQLRPHLWMLAQTFRSTVSHMSDAVSDLERLMQNAGRAIIDGIISGIQDKLPDLQTVLNSLKDKIVQWKGPVSDDQQLLVPAGQAIMGGLIVGLNSEMPEVRETMQAISFTVTSEMSEVRDAVNRVGFDIADALHHIRANAMYTEQVLKSIMSRIRQAVVDSVSDLVSSLTESGPQMQALADAISAVTSRIIEVVNRSTFAIADALSQLRPHFWMTVQTFKSSVSDISEVMGKFVGVINQGVFSVANALSDLRSHLWITARAFGTMASNISEVLAGLVGTVNEKVFSISEALRQLRSQLSITARAFESSPLRSPTNFAAPQLSMEAVAPRPGSVAPTPAAATAPVINITVQERDVAGEVERVLRRVLFQAGW